MKHSPNTWLLSALAIALPAHLAGATSGSTRVVLLDAGWQSSSSWKSIVPPEPFVDVAAVIGGFGYSGVLRTDGKFRGSSSTMNAPLDLSFTAVSIGPAHVAAITETGAAYCWGSNADGRATVPPGLPGVTSIAAGGYHTLATLADGRAVCWGRGTTGTGFGVVNVPPNWLTTASRGFAGSDLNMVITQSGALVGWGVPNSLAARIPSQLSGGMVQTVAIGNAYPQRAVGLLNSGRPILWSNNSPLVITSDAWLGTVDIAMTSQSDPIALRGDGTVMRLMASNTIINEVLKSPTTGRPYAGVQSLASGSPLVMLRFEDCNGNAVHDGDDIAFKGMFDLDHNEVPDSCQGATEYDRSSGSLGAPQGGVPKTVTFADLVPTDADTVLEIEATGDLDSSAEFITLRIDGAKVADLFVNGGVNCSAGSNAVQIPLSAAALNACAARGSMAVTLLPSPQVSATECPSGSMSVRLHYLGIGSGGDCDLDGTIDTREIGLDASLDWNRNGRLDSCDITADPSLDCDGNGTLDARDIATLPEMDADQNQRIDACEIRDNPALDCNTNGVLDAVEIAQGSVRDDNANHAPDACDIARNPGLDRNGNGVLDTRDCLDDPSIDLDRNGRIDAYEIADDPRLDRNGNGVLDRVECEQDASIDCNLNGSIDAYELLDDPSLDCDHDGTFDACQVAGRNVDQTGPAWGGENAYGELDTPSMNAVRQIACGENHSAAVLFDGSVVCWGRDDFGQTQAPSLAGVRQVACGAFHSLALKGDGMVIGWGLNSSGQANSHLFQLPTVAIAAGGSMSQAVLADGTVIGWGDNTWGGTDTPNGVQGVTQVACGYGHTVALDQQGRVNCWGRNTQGQCDMPAGLPDVRQVACGSLFTYALRRDGIPVGWGYNYWGNTDTPADLSNVVQIACGWEHTYALRGDGTVVGWGSNLFGETDTPPALTGIRQVACGAWHNYALQDALDANMNWQPDACELLQDPSLDADGNGVIDVLDIQRNPALDCDTDGRLDAWQLQQRLDFDCDGNGLLDRCDITRGALDDNLDGRPDRCNLGQGDFDLDGEVNVGDLALLLLYMGDSNVPFGDFDGDGIITTADLSMLLLNFGPVTWP